jgi:hypothetical protein
MVNWHPQFDKVQMMLWRRLLIDDRGQDLVEYLLLGATVAFAGLAAMNAFPGIASAVYASWDNAQQSLWYPAPPAP